MRESMNRFPGCEGCIGMPNAHPFADLADAWQRVVTGQNEQPTFKNKGTTPDSFSVANDKFQGVGRRVRLPKIGGAAGGKRSASRAKYWGLVWCVRRIAGFLPSKGRCPIPVIIVLAPAKALSESMSGTRPLLPRPLEKRSSDRMPIGAFGVA